MNILALKVLIGASVYMTSPVSAHGATQLAIELVTAQFKGAGIVPNVIPTFDPIGTLAANYSGIVSTTGAALPAINVTGTPEISIKGTEAADANSASPFNPANNSTANFTIIFIDGNYPGSNNPNGYNLHWLGNGFKIAETRDHKLILRNTFDVISYAGPSPPEGSGPHRYIFLVYSEPSNFTAPSSPAPYSGVQLFDLNAYVTAAKLGNPIAGNYFTVEIGTPSVTISTTTSIDSATLPAATLPTGSSGTSSGTSSGASATHSTTGAGYKVAIEATPLGVLVALGMVLLV